MFDMSWGEVMLIGGVALVVIGPKDLPKALRTVGQVTARLKRMAGEFQSQFSEAMREAELDEVRREVEGINRSVSSATSTGFNPVQTLRNEIKGAVDGAPKPATMALPGADPLSSDPSSSAPLPEPPPPVDPAAPPAYQPPEPAAEKPSVSALAAATAQLKADAARGAAADYSTSPDTASTGRTA
ncbi:Sec-independent protein translocase protein TatB [Methylobacterium frigidaeris]|uniref:Sec-independent protein translocase protein TatB n=1 Tax=Methylobacterium frigidaeris TaxID=2038277 RepID=A0AA37HAA8_9HYPH|nr:Sec-independent protein translocase protein TatB [Methylobacterium frigidaeris]PIK71340.1 twin-arginine translocase subunit TatB [Methylobacterium frigidaeris]GJD62313.1 Sec-independent protein translocase protein TatB [Methylobacterium frigidaeris]